MEPDTALEFVTINASGVLRTETLNGRRYLVVAATLIRPGVLNGSRGRLFYPPPEVVRNIDAWNAMPLTARHPKVNGQHVSARHPSVINLYPAGFGLGWVFNAWGKTDLGAEAWLDEQAVGHFDETLPSHQRILSRVRSGQPVELSTGLYTDNTPAPAGSVYNGAPYDFVATNYRPDHLAILPDETGACSVKDRCGLGVVNRYDEEEEDVMSSPHEDPTLLQRVIEAVSNAFCPTGKGGGIDPTCKRGSAAKGAAALVKAKSILGGSTRPSDVDLGHLRKGLGDMTVGQLKSVQKEFTGKAGKGLKKDRIDAIVSFAKGKPPAAFEKIKRDRTRLGLEAKSTLWGDLKSAFKSFRRTGSLLRNAEGDEPTPDDGMELFAAALQLRLDGDHESADRLEELTDNSSDEGEWVEDEPVANVVKKEGDKYVVRSESGKSLGEYDSREEAEERLRQVEYFKHKGTRNTSTDSDSEDDDMDKAAKVSYLTANCDCWKGKEGVLNGFEDEHLTKLVGSDKKARHDARVLANLGKPITHNGSELTLTVNSTDGTITVNATCPECGGAMKDGVCTKCGYAADDEETAPAEKKKPPFVKNSDTTNPTGNHTVSKWKNTQEWLADPASAPPEVKSAVRETITRNEREKTEIVGKLVANSSATDETQRNALTKRLMGKPLDELRDLQLLAPAANAAATPGTLDPNAPFDPQKFHIPFATPVTNYLGAAGGPAGVVTNKQITDDSADILEFGEVDYAAVSAGK